MKIGIANDHGGVDLKNKLIPFLEEKGYEVINYGSDTTERVDYPIYGFKVAEALKNKEIDYGIAICKSAIGMSVACNKVKGARCGKVDSVYDAEHGKSNDYINIIAISGSLDIEEAKVLVDTFIKTKHKEDTRYYERVEKIINYEKEGKL